MVNQQFFWVSLWILVVSACSPLARAAPVKLNPSSQPLTITEKNITVHDQEYLLLTSVLLSELIQKSSQGVSKQAEQWAAQSIELPSEINTVNRSIFETSEISNAVFKTFILAEQVLPNSSDLNDSAPKKSASDFNILETQLELSQSDLKLPQDRWQFLVEPYLFVPLDVQADITVEGIASSNLKCNTV
jgi:hypothetical protein